MPIETTPTGQPQDSAGNPAPTGEAPEGLSKESLDILGIASEEQPASQPAPQPQPAGDLLEEEKPYSQFPWLQMDAATREATLAAVKKFHGDMGRGQTEAGELKRQVAEYQDKANWLDSVTAQPWFQQAYQAHMNGQQVATPAAEAPPSFEGLTEHGLDADAVKLMDQAVEAKLRNILGPLGQKLENLERSMVQGETNTQLDAVTKWAVDKGYPTPADKMPLIRQLIQAGRATTIEDAYRLAISDDVPGLVETKTRAQVQADLKKKQEQFIPPGQSVAGSPQADFAGESGIKAAMAEALDELTALQGK